MALSATVTFEVRPTGNDANGGGFMGAGTLARPAAPSVSTATTGGTVAANTYRVVVVYVGMGDRESPASPETSITTTGATSTITTTSPPASPGAVAYRVYMGTVSGGPYWANPGTNVAIGTDSVRTTTPTGSGTQPPGTDYSQQNDPQAIYTDLVLVTAQTASSVARPFTPADVRNVINITGGTGFTPGWYEIIAVSTLAVATFDRVAGTISSTGGTGNLGGALATLTQAATLATNAGHNVFVKAGTYNETLTHSLSNSLQRWMGYNVVRGDNPIGDDRPVIDGQNTRANCVSVGGSGGPLHSNFIFKNATSHNVTVTISGSRFVDCKSMNSGASGFSATGAARFLRCEASGNAASGFVCSSGPTSFFGCVARENVEGVKHSGSGELILVNCLAYANAGPGIQETMASTSILMLNCTSANNTGPNGHGLDIVDGGVNSMTIMNNIFAGNAGYGILKAANTRYQVIDRNAFYNNALGAMSNLTIGPNDVTLDPQFVNAAGGNFAIGTNLRAAGSPGLFPGGLSQGYLDLGAVQRQEQGGVSRSRLIGGA